MADVWTGTKGDWLYRQHVKLCRKRIKAARKADAQRFLAFEPTKQPRQYTNLSAHVVKAKRKGRNGSNS